MANISCAHGTLYFSKKQIDVIRNELAEWVENFTCKGYGISYIDAIKEDVLSAEKDVSVIFDGEGRWTFESLLSPGCTAFNDEWMRKISRKLRESFTTQASIEIAFDDWEPGVQVLYHSEGFLVPEISDYSPYAFRYHESDSYDYAYTVDNLYECGFIDEPYSCETIKDTIYFLRAMEDEGFAITNSSISPRDISEEIKKQGYFKGFVPEMDLNYAANILLDAGFLKEV